MRTDDKAVGPPQVLLGPDGFTALLEIVPFNTELHLKTINSCLR